MKRDTSYSLIRKVGCGTLDRPTKVAFLCQINHSNNIGGADIHIQNILQSLSKIDNLEIHVVTMSKTKNTPVMKNNRKIIYHILKSPKLPKTITAISVDHKALIKKVNEIKPDIIHAQVLGAPYGLAAMKLCKRYPTVLTVHTLVEMDAKNRRGTVKEKIHDSIWKNIEKKEIKRVPNFIAVSKNIERELYRRGAQNIQVIPNGISQSWFNIPNAEINGRILFVGRIIPIKAIETVLQALKQVKHSIPNAHLNIVGPILDRDYKKKLDVLILKLDMIDSVKFTGSKSGADIEKEYAECSVFVLPSKNESFGIVILEAMATGKPIVATNVGGISEILTDEREGYLVEYGNVKQMAEKIIKLLSEKNLRKSMGDSGREHAKKFTWQTIAKQTVDYYKEILGERQ